MRSLIDLTTFGDWDFYHSAPYKNWITLWFCIQSDLDF